MGGSIVVERWCAQIKTIIYKHAGVTATVAAAMFYIVLFAFFNPIYNENDDVIMMNIIQGNYTGEKSAYVVFINYALSKLLVWLYSAIPNLAWYGLMMYFVMWTSLAVLLYILIKSKVHWLMKMILFLFLLNYYLRFGLFLQFSTVSILATFSGVALYIYAKLNNLKNLILMFLAWMLCLLGYLIRDHTFYIVIFAMAPILYLLIRNKYFDYREITKSLFVIGISFGAFYLSHYCAYSSNPEWSRFLDLQKYRQYIHEFTFTQATDPITFKPILDSVGWSYNDYLLMLNWLYSDKELYSTIAIQSYVQQMTMARYEFALSYAPIYIVKQLLSPTSIEYLVYTIAMMVVLIFFAKKMSYLLSLGFLIAMIILGVLGRLPDRVLSPLLFCYIFSFSLHYKDADKVNKLISSKFNKFILLGCVYFVLVTATFVFSINLAHSDQNKLRIKYFNDQLKLMPQSNEEFLLMFPLLLPIQWNSPLSFSIGLKPGTIIFGSWLQQSPHEDLIMKNKDITDIYESLYKNDSVRLLTVDFYIPYIREYLLQHYDVRVNFEQVGGFPKSDVFGTDRVKIYEMKIIE